MLRITLASLHLLALSLGMMATVLRGSALREPLTAASLKRALRLDNIWGIALIGHVQATIALVMIFLAVAMARGYGVMATP